MFNPYREWLGIPDNQTPPNNYRLLGIELYEADPNVISAAADRAMLFVRTYQTGPHSAESQRILNEISSARVCLLKPDKKEAYDKQLCEQLAKSRAASLDMSSSSENINVPAFDLKLNPDSAKKSITRRKRQQIAKRISSIISVVVLLTIAGVLGAYVYMKPDKPIDSVAANTDPGDPAVSSSIISSPASGSGSSSGSQAHKTAEDSLEQKSSSNNIPNADNPSESASQTQASEIVTHPIPTASSPKIGDSPLITFADQKASVQALKDFNRLIEGRLLAVVCDKACIKVYQLPSLDIYYSQDIEEEIFLRRIAWSPNGRYLAAGGNSSKAYVWDMTTKEQIFELNGHTKQVNDLRFSPDGTQLLTSSLDGSICRWDYKAGALLQTYTGLGVVWTVSYSPDGKTVAVAGETGSVSLLNLESGEILFKVPYPGMVQEINFSPDGSKIMVVHNDQPLRFLDPKTGITLGEINHSGIRKTGDFSSDGSLFAVAGSNNSFFVGNGKNPASGYTDLNPDSQECDTCSITRDGNQILLGNSHGYVKIIDRKTNTVLISFKNEDKRCWDVKMNEPYN